MSNCLGIEPYALWFYENVPERLLQYCAHQAYHAPLSQFVASTQSPNKKLGMSGKAISGDENPDEPFVTVPASSYVLVQPVEEPGLVFEPKSVGLLVKCL